MPETQDQAAPPHPWRIASLALFTLALGLTTLTLDDPGLVWDEPFSIDSGRAYAAWLGELPRGPFSREAIRFFWAPNHEHPPLAKLLMGVAQALVGDRSPIMSSRLTAALLFALLVELVFKFAAGAFGGLAGLVAAGSLLCMPRVFGHAHFAALDVPMSLAWLLSVVAFARAIRKGTHGACALSGICFGLALLTKINAVFLPPVLVGWGLGFHGRRALKPLAWTLLLGPVVFVAGWPWLWYDTLTRIAQYVRPTWRVSIPVLYFGRVYGDKAAPWHYPLVMTLVTIPVGVLFLVVLGSVRAVREFRRQPVLALVTINAACIIGIFMVPGVPKYDGVRLFLPAFPFLAILAGVAGKRCWEWLAERSRKRPWRPLFVTAAFFVSQAAATWWMHPCELSYYNALVGGLWGADKLGMETTYWHDVVNRDLFRWLNRRCAVRQVVAFYPVGETVVFGPQEGKHVPNYYDGYYLNDPTNKHLMAVRLESARRYDFVVINARKAMILWHKNELAWRYLTEKKPLYAVRKQGVLLAGVYARD